MKIPRRTFCCTRIVAAALIAYLLAPPALPAYIQELSENEINEAYQIGQRRDQDMVRFFKKYEAVLPNALSNVHVQHLAVRTPYCAVVIRSFEAAGRYSLRQAIADAAEHAGVFQVVVWINGYTNVSAGDISEFKSIFWRAFAVEFTQQRKIEPRKMRAFPLYSEPGRPSAIIGAQVYVEYDVHDIASAPARIQVTDPDGHTVSADFDLDKLR